MRVKFIELVGGAVVAAMVLSVGACDIGGKATATAPTAGAAGSTAAQEAGGGQRQVNWAASRTRSAGESLQAQFERNGQAFGAETADDYAARARDFVASPPKGTQMATRRNGDVLLYDPVTNVFAVATSDGKPRTMFKPRDGATYWAEQKARAGQQARGGSGRASDEG